MKLKCSFFLLLISICSSSIAVQAQTGKDTTFLIYFNSSQYKTDTAQQKAFETFLKSVHAIKTIHGFTDTTGNAQLNYQLAQKRAAYIYNLLPHSIKARFNRNNLKAFGESNNFEELWQNRRVEVVAELPAEIIEVNYVPAKDTLLKLNADNILFFPDQPILTEASFGYVKALAQQLQAYRTEKFQIIGHVNYQSSLPADRLKDLYQLSEARAKAVYDLLVKNGMDAGRMTYKGVGNSDPVFPEPVNEEQKRANMRVQVVILR